MKTLINITDSLRRLWLALPDHLRRVLHTAWQVAAGAFLAYLTVHSGDAESLGIWTLVYSAGLSAAKAGFLSLLGRRS